MPQAGLISGILIMSNIPMEGSLVMIGHTPYRIAVDEITSPTYPIVMFSCK